MAMNQTSDAGVSGFRACCGHVTLPVSLGRPGQSEQCQVERALLEVHTLSPEGDFEAFVKL